MKRWVVSEMGLRSSRARLVRWVPPLLGFLAFLSLSPAARADLIYESAQSLLTGAWTSELGGVETDTDFQSGVNFFLSSPVLLTDIGGKFTDASGGPLGNNEIFGAVVKVNSQFDKPDLSTNLLGTTLITLPTGKDVENVSGSLSLTLTPGWYALLFGTGLFGATGNATAVQTMDNKAANTTTGDITYAISTSSGSLFTQAPGARYFAEGTPAVAAPEPASFTLLGLGLAGLAGYGWRRRQK